MFSIIVNVTSRADPQEAVLAFRKCSWGFLYFFAESPLLERAGGREPAMGERRLSLGHALTRSCEVSHALVEVGVTASNRTFFSPRGTCTLWAKRLEKRYIENRRLKSFERHKEDGKETHGRGAPLELGAWGGTLLEVTLK